MISCCVPPVSPIGLAYLRYPSDHVATTIGEPLNQRCIMTFLGCNTCPFYSEIHTWIQVNWIELKNKCNEVGLLMERILMQTPHITLWTMCYYYGYYLSALGTLIFYVWLAYLVLAYTKIFISLFQTIANRKKSNELPRKCWKRGQKLTALGIFILIFIL